MFQNVQVEVQVENKLQTLYFSHKLFQNVPECSRMFQNVPEGSKKFQKVPEGSRMHEDPWGFMQIPDPWAT